MEDKNVTKQSTIDKKEIQAKRQQDIYLYLNELHRENAIPPTFREIQKALGISSTWVVQNDIKELAKKGLITYIPKKPRSIAIVERNEKTSYPVAKGKSLKDIYFLTAMERKIYFYIIDYFNLNHFSISIQDIAKAFDMPVNAAASVLDKFEKYNLITRDKGVHRSIRIVEYEK